ncbi:MAG: MFS transporter [Chloroflexota bacterium]|nr:MFS transporter [Chloroflexota bacterium]
MFIAFAGLPRQFWIIVGGQLINSIGGSMIMPFFTLYVTRRFALPMTGVGMLFVVFTVVGIFARGFGGAWADRFGRKRIMAASLAVSAFGLMGLALADSLVAFLLVLIVFAFFNTMFQPANDAMVADLVGEEKRQRAYSWQRVARNLGVAIGPAIGGFLAALSYLYSFSGAAIASVLFCVIVLLLTRETLPADPPRIVSAATQQRGGYSQVVRDAPFVSTLVLFVLLECAVAQTSTTLPVYMKNSFGLAEDKFGWVMTTNAGMVVGLQFLITLLAQRFPRLRVLALGAFFYAVGVGAFALATTFGGFIFDMALITIGEMLFFPAISALTADFAPEHLRGRYMGLFAIANGIGWGLGPVMGGALYDNFNPQFLWLVMALFAFAATLGFAIAARVFPSRAQVPVAVS